MKYKWKTVSVGDLGRVVTGKTPKTAIEENYGGHIPFLTPSDNMNVKFVESTSKTLTSRGLSEVKNCLLPPRSICVSCIGSDLGKVVMTTSNTITNQQINSIIPSIDYDADFVYYAMTILGKQLNYISKTSTAVPIVNKSAFSAYEISVPPLEVQREIGRTLSALDDKIAVNNKLNHHLEQMAQAIFKSWFVDFEPTYKSLGELCHCILGGTPSRAKPEYWGGNIPWINSGKVNEFRIIEPSERITEKGLNSSATKLLPVKTTVIAITGATLGQVSLLEISACANQSVVGVIPNDELPYTFIYPFIVDSIGELISHQTGGAQQHINKQNIEGLQMPCYPASAMQEYNSKVEPILEQISVNCFENARLATLRDTLLPRLMSGELSVADVDAK